MTAGVDHYPIICGAGLGEGRWKFDKVQWGVFTVSVKSRMGHMILKDKYKDHINKLFTASHVAFRTSRKRKEEAGAVIE